MVQKPHPESKTFRQYLEGILAEYKKMLADSKVEILLKKDGEWEMKPEFIGNN